MAVVHPPTRGATIDIAGSAWPVHKFDAVVIGLVTFLLLALITGSPQVAVLTAAGVGAVRWLGGLAAAQR
ncbi:hypothetical protein [Nocardia sp. R6R-6]|uniref:hypothetical protein n=1 Tax=Nocardia sp. R6R-6 TaxID=3459303 RepID=UPI00403E1164